MMGDRGQDASHPEMCRAGSRLGLLAQRQRQLAHDTTLLEIVEQSVRFHRAGLVSGRGEGAGYCTADFVPQLVRNSDRQWFIAVS